jgi:hypothetical protein
MIGSPAYLVAALAAIGLRQDPAPAPPPANAPLAQAHEPALVAGQLPASASEEAKALWNSLVAATRVAPDVQKPTGFDLTFDIRAHPQGVGSNDLPKTRYRFESAHGWVRMTMKQDETTRERLRGPGGDFLIDQHEIVSLKGREHDEDRKQIREELAIAKNFLALADPKSLRLASLAKLSAPPRELPTSNKPRNDLASVGKSLDWLSIESPDFHMFQSKASKPDANYRVQIGLDPKTHLPRFAIVAELRSGAPDVDGAMLVDLQNYAPLDGFQIPRSIATFAPDLERMPWAFSEWSNMELALASGGTLRPSFTEKDFVPPGG